VRRSIQVSAVLVLAVVGAWQLRDNGGVERAAPPAEAPASAELLQAASGGDGDSWKDTSGREYRLGMVNAPEVGECWSREATTARRALVDEGFRADVYTRDRYGRGVAVVTTVDGTNVNVTLARGGHVDDRYLEQFRHENRPLAAALDVAFAAAKRDRAGLWGACTRE
jgi:endonuclease YncB( thermonuclease family)